MSKKNIIIAALLFLLFAGSVAFYTIKLQSIQIELTDFYNHPNKVRMASNNMRTHLENAQKNLLLAATSGSTSEAAAYLRAAELSAEKTAQEYEILERTVLFAERNKLLTLGKTLGVLKTTAIEIENYIRDGDKEQAIYLLKSAYSANMLIAVDITQYYFDFSQKKGEELLSMLKKNLTGLPFIMSVFSLFIFIAFGGFTAVEQVRHELKLRKIAFYDEMTGLPNLFKSKIELENQLKKPNNQNGFIIQFDIENFKMINDLFSFAAGDSVIKTVAKALENTCRREKDITFIGRTGTDNFIMFGSAQTVQETEKILHSFEKEFERLTADTLDRHKIHFKYGRYFFYKEENSADSIFEKVNLAHSLVKTQKEKSVYDYDSRLKEQLIRDIRLTNRMEFALENEEFKLYLQPKYNLKTEKLSGAEALVRWQQGDGILMYPGDFIPLFEKNGFVVKLDMYMLRATCRKLRQWLDSGLKPVTISVNFSKLHLFNPLFVEEICAVTDKFAIPRKLIEAEITESTMFNNEDMVISMLEKLHAQGFSLSMDDFGAGYSSLGLLKNICVDTIKMDRSFLTDYKNAENARAVTESVIRMAKKIHMETVAEGVETGEHVLLLKELECDIAQGYYYAKPMPAQEFEQLLTSFSKKPAT